MLVVFPVTCSVSSGLRQEVFVLVGRFGAFGVVLRWAPASRGVAGGAPAPYSEYYISISPYLPLCSGSSGSVGSRYSWLSMCVLLQQFSSSSGGVLRLCRSEECVDVYPW